MKDTAAYAARLKALREEQARLERKHAALLDQRRAELARLLEKLELLEAEDDLLVGALLELKDAINQPNDERLARWRAAGVAFHRKDANRKAAPSRSRNSVAESNAHAPRS